MDDTTREQMKQELAALRAQLEASRTQGSPKDVELQEHIDSLEELVAHGPGDAQAYTRAQLLEQRLLAWEAEHPQLAALAARVARVLEDSGM